MDRSRVVENEGGGVQLLNGAKFIVTNSFIVGNKVGGGFSAIMPTSDSRLEFNTIVDNIGPAGSTGFGGVLCDGNASANVRYNIIYRNTGGAGAGGGMVQRNGDCNFSGNYETAAPAGDTLLKFKSETGPKDYHLTAESPRQCSMFSVRSALGSKTSTAKTGRKAVLVTSAPMK